MLLDVFTTLPKIFLATQQQDAFQVLISLVEVNSYEGTFFQMNYNLIFKRNVLQYYLPF